MVSGLGSSVDKRGKRISEGGAVLILIHSARRNYGQGRDIRRKKIFLRNWRGDIKKKKGPRGGNRLLGIEVISLKEKHRKSTNIESKS